MARRRLPNGRTIDHLGKRLEKETSSRKEKRSPFQRDRDRLLYTNEFRRLAAVTQVVSATEGLVFHNRLTHSLKVAQIARRLAERFSQRAFPIYGTIDPDTTETAALAHDLGHPPFGHVAEETLDHLAKKAGLLDGFEGNAQSFRIVCQLAARKPNETGLNLTRGALNGILKYPWKRGFEGEKHQGYDANKKWGYYSSEAPYFAFARDEFPFGESQPSPEAALMTIADDITYSVHDMQDFFQAGLIPIDQLRSENPQELDEFIGGMKALRSKEFDEYTSDDLRDQFIGLMELMDLPAAFDCSGSHQARAQAASSRLITRFVGGVQMSSQPTNEEYSFRIKPSLQVEIDLLQGLTWYYVIFSSALATLQHGQKAMITKLFEVFVEAANSGKEKAWFILPLNARLELQRLAAIHQYAIPANDRIRVAIDAVAGMNEHQVIHMYQRLTGTGPGSILDKIVV